MPTYEYMCPKHGRFTEIRVMGRRHEPAYCACGAESEYCISAPRVFGDFEGFVSPASGQWVEGRRQRAEDMLRTGCRPYDEGEREELPKRRADIENQIDAQVEDTIDRVIGEMRSN